MTINTREIFSAAAPALSLSAIGASVWWGMRSIGITNFSPLGVGLAAGTYTITKKIAEPLFQRLFEADPTAPGYNQSTCFYVTELASASAAIITIYTIGILSLSVFTATSIIEVLFFLKGIEFLSTKIHPLMHQIEMWLDTRFPDWAGPVIPADEIPVVDVPQ